MNKSKLDYNGKKFKSISNSQKGEVSDETIFTYQQYGNILSGDYSGGQILQGNILGKVNPDGSLNFFYHHINIKGEISLGKCHSTSDITKDGRVRLLESWEWIYGRDGKGESIIEELPD